MGQQDNIQSAQRLGEAVNSGQLEQLRDLIAPGSLDHDPAPGQVAGPEGFIGFFTTLRTAFPDLHLEVEHLVADQDNVAFAYTITGTHQGDFQGVPATGRSIKARGVQIGRYERGLLVERWGSSDELGILKQLGADKPGS